MTGKPSIRPACAYTQAGRRGGMARRARILSPSIWSFGPILRPGGGSPRGHERAWYLRCRIFSGDQSMASAFIRLCRRPGPAYSAVVAYGYEGWIRPWMNGTGGPLEARRAKEGASADFAEEMKDTTGLRPWRLHGRGEIDSTPRSCCRLRGKTPLNFLQRVVEKLSAALRGGRRPKRSA